MTSIEHGAKAVLCTATLGAGCTASALQVDHGSHGRVNGGRGRPDRPSHQALRRARWKAAAPGDLGT
jgi:hypothetical protein